MRQQINLFQPQRQRHGVWLSAHSLAWGSGLLVLGLALASSLFWWGEQRELRELAGMRVEHADRSGEAVALQRQLEERRADSAVQIELDRLEAELAAKRRFLHSFDPLEGAQGQGFADVLSGLAQGRVEGVWLREIRITRRGELRFEGSATDPALVPRFVDALGQQSAFQGRDFRHLRIERMENARQVDFSLQTRGER
ncbi:hypothetical protein CAI21_13265 [Alkalilimnicola ehrlichii]|uniref:Fimbrial assembly family protein n=1 Tax=Alkalilimnicola ehrlichii TaxID=351052 RepID=A0A3E0WPG8_9GAMM|nr:PilN domain-containing protein [Alkalilimnicola ehrlichii]RFA28280.1 hypothetical protein CAI21_13265 [Alkalilimnicola ehrlichii]RFA34880.1 hypothetical protein CAL65_14400 [Alkalilimnicola ehrlichii]